MNRILSIVRKEFIQIFRDTRTLIIVLIFPIFLLLLFGYAITLDINNITLAVCDLDNSSYSRELIQKFTESSYFNMKYFTTDEKKLLRYIDSGKIKVLIKIPPDFQEKISSGKTSSFQVIIDGSDSNTANIILGYTNLILQDYLNKIMVNLISRQGGKNIDLPVELRDRVLFNPELKSMNFIVPGLIGVIMMVTTVALISLSIVKEREKGTIEAILVSPVKSYEFILGKLIPNIIIAFADFSIILFGGIIIFGVPFRGSFLLLFFLSGLFLLSALGIGLIISSITQSQQVAWTISLISTLLPSLILSGFIFPISSMPKIIQIISGFFPIRYFLVILRGIILKGVGFQCLFYESIILTIFGIFLLSVSILRFKKKVI